MTKPCDCGHELRNHREDGCNECWKCREYKFNGKITLKSIIPAIVGTFAIIMVMSILLWVGYIVYEIFNS
jgi:hypothetical protein